MWQFVMMFFKRTQKIIPASIKDSNKTISVCCFIILIALHAVFFSSAKIFSSHSLQEQNGQEILFVFDTNSFSEQTTVQNTKSVPEVVESTEMLPDKEKTRIAENTEQSNNSFSAPANDGIQGDSEYIALIMRRLEEKKIYPLAMRKRGIEGDMTVQFTIRSDGSLGAVKPVTTGEHQFLVQAALETVKAAEPFPVMQGTNKDFSLYVTIKYKLQ